MITKSQYFHLSLVLLLPLLGLGYYLAEKRVFDPWEYNVFCNVSDGTCSISKLKGQGNELKDFKEYSILIFKDTKAALSYIDFPLRSYVLDIDTSKYEEVNRLNYLSFYQCSFEILYANSNVYSFNCYLDKAKTAIVSGKFEFVNGIDEQWYLKTHTASSEAKKEIHQYHQQMFYLTLFLPLFLYFLISWLAKFILYGFKKPN